MYMKTSKKIFFPKIQSIEYFGKNKIRFCVGNLKNGLAVTLGCALRRVLLSFIPGYAVTKVKIEDVFHEYAVKDGLCEDIVDVLLNLKDVMFCGDIKQDEIRLFLSKTGGVVYASDFVLPQYVVISNPKKVLAHLENYCTLNMIVHVSKGFGYTPVFSLNKSDFLFSQDKKSHDKLCKDLDDLKGNWLYLDSFYSPIKRVNYFVSNYNQNDGFESLIIEIETCEGKDPQECMKYAAQFLKEHFQLFIDFDSKLFLKQSVNIKLNSVLWDRIESLNLSSRAYNCLLSENIIFLGDLVQKFESDLLRIQHLGSKILFEIKGALLLKGLMLGMYVKNWHQLKNAGIVR